MLRFLRAFSSEERRLIKGVLINELPTCSDLALGKVLKVTNQVSIATGFPFFPVFMCARYFLCFQVHTVSPAKDNSRDTVFKTLF